MLIEHKAEVGHKYINKVWVWESESAHKLPCLMFGVQPVTTPAQTPQGVVEARDYMVRMVETRHGEQSTRNFLREHVIYV